MRRWMLAGNWKMHNTVADSVGLARSIADGAGGVTGGDIVIAPVFTALAKVYEVIGGSTVCLAAQNVFWEEKGAYTGEISPSMLKDVGCTYVIIGHSERRKYFHETDESVNAKVKESLAVGLKPIMCVGETEEEREKGVTDFVIGIQILKGLNGIDSIGDVAIAYEPVWAIGTGRTATPDQAESVHRFIRGILADKYSNDVAEETRILYGGSVTPDNAGRLMQENDVDGALIGGASLKSETFLSIIRAVSGR
jgi:triosephosphate isomerase (TIM)